MLAYQYDHAGLLAGTTQADPSPLEPDVLLLPARCTVTEPPSDIQPDQWPRWNGSAWELVTRPTAPAEPTATEKLAAFLQANPDVAALITPPTL